MINTHLDLLLEMLHYSVPTLLFKHKERELAEESSKFRKIPMIQGGRSFCIARSGALI